MARHAGQYRRAHLVGKATAYGWHQFMIVWCVGEVWWRCAQCGAHLPDSALVEEFWSVWAGQQCPDFLRPISAVAGPWSDGPSRTTLF